MLRRNSGTLRKSSTRHGLFLWTLVAAALPVCGQTKTAPSEAPPSYNLSASVDEVSLIFHVSDASGLPVNDLKASELRVLDNGKPPRRIVDFHFVQDHAIHAGFLMDSSDSMREHLPRNRAISVKVAQRVLRQKTDPMKDQAFVVEFGYSSRILQSWTSDPAQLVAGINHVVAGKENFLGGTAMYDTLYRTCLYDFAKLDHTASGNFILLFSDGEDNASHTSLQDVVNVCQNANTAIYAFRAVANSRSISTGPKNLTELTEQTGGRVFYDDESEDQINSDIAAIETELRNQYRLIYNPPDLKHDGSFHRIDLLGPDRARNISARSGYYAPTH